MPVLCGMKPGGYYDQHSSFQRATVAALLPWIDQAVADMTLPDERRPFTIADYGCSEGSNSILAVGQVAAALRRRRPAQPVCGVHCDLPTNNFNRLLASLHDPSTSNYLQDRGTRRPNVCALATGASFYGPVMPPRSVQFALSFAAVNWLERVPEVSVPQFIAYLEAAPAARRAFARQAARDLAVFYRHRAQELAAGGKLLVVVPGSDGTHRCSDGRYRLLNDAGVDLVAAGRIDRGRWERFVFPTYFRTLEEMLAPLQHSDGPDADAFAADRAELLELPIPFVDRFRETGDKREYAAEYAGFLRAFSEPVLAKGLSANAATLDALYSRAADRLVAEPDRYALCNIKVAVLLTRRDHVAKGLSLRGRLRRPCKPAGIHRNRLSPTSLVENVPGLLAGFGE
jgi:SAM dependent carboxyl methyltransferase